MRNTYTTITPNAKLSSVVAPSHILRSSIFGVVKRGGRAYVEEAEIAVLDKCVIKYCGPELDGKDCDLWLTLVNLAIKNGLHEEECKGYLILGCKTILKQMGKSTGSNNRIWLEKSMKRLVSASLIVHSEKHKYAGSFIPEIVFEEHSGRMLIKINQQVAAIFKSGTWIDCQVRFSLRTDLAKWLHSYISAQKGGGVIHKLSVEKMRLHSGSTHLETRKFKFALKKAIIEIAGKDLSMTIDITENNVVEYSRVKKKKKKDCLEQPTIF